MNLLAKVGNMLSGGLLEKAGSKLLDRVLPDKLTDEEKLQYDMEVAKENNKTQVALMQLAAEADKAFNDRLNKHEGTAKELRALPIVGPVLITLRGVQRPVWGFATLFFDYKFFITGVTLSETGESLLMLINALVLGFLFGERAIKNVMPVINEYFGKKRRDDKD